MDVINRIADGVHLDNNEYDQPDNTMRNNRNGVIFDLVSGNYVWKNLKGTLQVLDLATNDYVMRSCWIRSRYFLFVLNTNSNYVQLKELLFGVNGSVSSTAVRWQTTNTLMNMSKSYPIRAMFGVFENEEIQRIYWSDFNNHPRCINLGNEVSVTPNEKFIDLFPILDNSYGSIKFTAEIPGGNLKAGVYFFCWRLFKEGYYTDWSYLSSPIPVFNGSIGSTYADYHLIEGAKPNEKTTKGLQLTLGNIDNDYEKIQVASFYSNDYNSIAEGMIIYENIIVASTIVFNYTGGENAGTVTTNELMITSILIEKCFDMMSIKKRNVMANLVERSELDFSNLASGKNNQINVSILPSQYGILLDTTPYGFHSGTPYTKELYGIKTAALEISTYKLFSGMYHYAVTDVHYHEALTENPVTIPAGKYFKTPGLGVGAITGTAKLAIVIKKYRKASASIPYDLTDDYVLDATTVDNEYYNYKNPRFTEKLKGYPAGEKIRLGVLFLDKTGRPFFARYLYNTEIVSGGLTIGPGDTRIPERGENGSFNIAFSDRFVSDVPEYYKNTIGLVNYLTVSGIDISSVKDKIGAFMIVRSPIERQNLAYGALGFMNRDNNDVWANKCFRAEADDSAHYPGAYAFYCPEDMFEFKDFSIQPGDKLVNRYYMTPFYPQGTPKYGGGSYVAGMQGYGVEMDAGNGLQYNIYQKFYVPDDITTPTGNGVKGVEHEIIAYTKYRQGDGDEIVFDPRDETKWLRYRSVFISGSPLYTYLTNLGIAVIDIDETGNNVKGLFDLPEDSPRMLMCTIKRENTNPYGGTGDAALASSVYISTGHYQEINDTVLNDIKSGDSYIFNEIDVFGGDTFVCIWDFLHTMRNEDLDGVSGRYSHSFLLPIESRINLDLREGDHVGQFRCYPTVNGMRWKTGNDKWELFNYNDGYSSDNASRYHLPLPNNFRLENIFDTRIRYSNEKSYGEYEDKYRKFSALDYFTIETMYGPIINIRSKNNNIIYWQKNGVGYIPMGERALTSNDMGNAVQLGVGGIFERYDNLIDMIGNSNQFGLVESDEGFTWYDGIRKLLVSLNNGMKFSQESIVKGIDSYLVNTVPNNIDSFDNPTLDYGVISGYDPREKMVYITFRMNGFDETVGINIKSNKFVGFFDFQPRLYFSFRDYMYAVINNSKTIHQHGTGTIGSYHGVTKDRYFTIIVKDPNNLAKIFETFELIGNDKFFATIDFTLEDGSTTKEYYSGANSRHLSQRLEYRNKRWFGNYPKISRQRLVSGYVKITFTDTGTDDLRFLQLKTAYQEMI
jgi:hypothetical protein